MDAASILGIGLGAIGGTSFSVWFGVYMTKNTLPKMAAENRATITKMAEENRALFIEQEKEHTKQIETVCKQLTEAAKEQFIQVGTSYERQMQLILDAHRQDRERFYCRNDNQTK